MPQESHPDPFLTTAFDGSRYRPVRLLGAGAMGDVWEVEHLHLRNRFAAKLMSRGIVEDARLIERMRSEARALAKLSHPHLVKVIDLAQAGDGRWFFVMELLRGQDLGALLDERQRLAVPEAIDIALQILQGLGAAHAAGLIHRDIKPPNIFCCERPKGGPPLIKLVDFGVAKHEAGALTAPAIPTATGIVVGTPRYMAPEQVSGKTIDHRADLYALGLVLYRMVAGRGPFDHNETVATLMKAQLRERPEPPSFYAPDLPPALDAIILRALEKSPDKRHASAAELAAALENMGNEPAMPDTIPARRAAAEVATPRITEKLPPRVRPPQVRTTPMRIIDTTEPCAPALDDPPPIQPAPIQAVQPARAPARKPQRRLFAAIMAAMALATAVLLILVTLQRCGGG